MNSYVFEMEEADILKEYREAKFPAKQIKILAEQNLVPPKVMREVIVSRLGDEAKLRTMPVRKGCYCWTEESIEDVRKLAGMKMSDSEIGECLGVSAVSVRNIRYAHGIPIGKYVERKRA